MDTKKDIKKTVVTRGLIVLAIIGFGWVTILTVSKEVNKYTSSWKEIQFAKNHPTLVEPMMTYYESGLKALDTLTVEKNVPTPKQSN